MAAVSSDLLIITTAALPIEQPRGTGQESKARSPTEAAPSDRATDTREVLRAVFEEDEADECETIGLGDRYVGGPAVGPMEVRSSGG